MADPVPVLPKGIVLNTSWIYDEIAKETVVTPEAIKKYWRVYTTTFQRLFDPTANRLENFWWHVWGSDRRHLPAPVLAQLFKDISTGPTFVKLRGPPNRYEPPSQPSSPVLSPVEAPNAQAIPKVKQNAREPKAEKKAVGSSSSKKPPAKPILKKPRGPSSSGPRPTARFVSPPGTDVEDAGSRESEVASSTSTTVTSTSGTSKTVGGASNKESKKKTTTGGPKKKGPTFVASTSRRRPALPRRQSSQSTTGGSETTSKEKGRGDSPVPTPESEPKLSAKAGGKRPVTQAKSEEKPSSKASTNHKPAAPGDEIKSPSATHLKEIIEPRTIDSRDGAKDNALVRNEEEEAKVTEPGFTRKSSNGRERTGTESSTMSNPFSPRRGSSEASRGRRVIALTSSSTTTTSNATAQGTIIEFDDNLPSRRFREENEHLDREPSSNAGISGLGSSSAAAAPSYNHDASALFAPTPPSSAPAVPLGRSKSQLALLLERQGDKKHRR